MSDKNDQDTFFLQTISADDPTTPRSGEYRQNMTFKEVILTAETLFSLLHSEKRMIMLMNSDGTTCTFNENESVSDIKNFERKKIILLNKIVVPKYTYKNKTIEIETDITEQVKNIVDKLFENFGIQKLEGYTLFIKNENGTFIPLDTNKKLVETTLNFNEFFFQRCYFVISRVSLSDPATLFGTYKDCVDFIMENTFLEINENLAKVLILCRCFAEGKLSQKEITECSFDIEKMVPPSANLGIDFRRKFIEFAANQSFSAEEAAMKFIRNCRRIPSFGSIRFKSTSVMTESGKYENPIIEIGPLHIKIFDETNQLITTPISYASVNSVTANKENVTLRYIQRDTRKLEDLIISDKVYGQTITTVIANYISINSCEVARSRRSSATSEDPVQRILEDYAVEYRRATRTINEATESFTNTETRDSMYNRILAFYSKKATIQDYIDHLEMLISELDQVCSNDPERKQDLPEGKTVEKLVESLEKANKTASEARSRMRKEDEMKHSPFDYYNIISENVMNGVSSMLANWDSCKEKGLPSDRLIVINKMHETVQFYKSEVNYINEIYSKLGFFEKFRVNIKPDRIDKKLNEIVALIIDEKTTLSAATHTKARKAPKRISEENEVM